MLRVAARSGLASLDGPGADRSKSTSCGPQQWRVNPDREHGRVDRVDTKSNPVDGLSRGDLRGSWDLEPLIFPGPELSAAYRRALKYAPA